MNLLENPALIGLVGVMIGALVSFFGVMYTENAKLKVMREEQKLARARSITENKQQIYRQFLDLINQFHNIMLSQIINIKDFSTNEERKNLLKSISSTLSELDLIAPKEISEHCHIIYNNILQSVFNSNEFKTKYDTLVELLKKDLNISNFD